jgi:hypothetical protein
MWFLPLGATSERWFAALVMKLLQNDRATLGLMARNPFPDRPPRAIRARLYRYRYTNPSERRATGAWWIRTLVGEYLPPTAPRAAERGD